MKLCKHSKGLTPYPIEYGIALLNCNECGVDLSPNVIPIIDRAEKAEARSKEIESAWQDAELRAEKAEARMRELEAES